ncbi:MAG: site-2 protease family protein [Pseudomonadota bacterium]
MFDTLSFAIVFIPCLIIAIVFHEVAHGLAAKALGDPTASERGRLSLNPLRHVDPIGTVLVPGGLLLLGAPAFGWAKPVPVNKWRLSDPRFDMMAVAAAGPLSNFVLAFVGAVVLGVIGTLGASFSESAAGFPMLVAPDGTSLQFETGLYFFILIKSFWGCSICFRSRLLMARTSSAGCCPSHCGRGGRNSSASAWWLSLA